MPRPLPCVPPGPSSAGGSGTACRRCSSTAAPAAATRSAGCSATRPCARSRTPSTRSCGPGGRWSPGSLGLVTTSHAVASEVLRSDRFGVGWDRSAAPRLDPLGAALRRRARRDRRGRAAVHARRRPARPHPLPAAGQPGLHAPRDRRVRAGGPAHRRRTARRARAPRRRGGPRRDLRRAAAGAGHRRPAGRAHRAPRGLPALGRRRGRDPGPRAAVPPLRGGRAGAAGHARASCGSTSSSCAANPATTSSAGWSGCRTTRR